jgi:hypothetical protein
VAGARGAAGSGDGPPPGLALGQGAEGGVGSSQAHSSWFQHSLAKGGWNSPFYGRVEILFCVHGTVNSYKIAKSWLHSNGIIIKTQNMLRPTGLNASF